MKRLVLSGAVSAALAYFFDPQSGARRRNVTRDRVLAFFRRRGREAARAGRTVTAEAYGVSQKVQHLREEPKNLDDATLAQKVQSEIFRDASAPKGAVDVNVQEGVVQLRGEVETQELIDELVAKARKVQGVREVENLLHPPGAPARMHQ
ncbi:MAG: BON domain-containing protein [Actinobacteria bacterium]|nr:BON domain-containing protein [Actinomycetota bacterium]